MEEITSTRATVGRRSAVALIALCIGLCATPTAVAGSRLWAVGDGAVPGTADDSLAARVAKEGIDRLLYLGDVYESGTTREFETNYASSWGRFKPITSPTPGNHEWGNHEEGYDRYWGRRAFGARGAHYYSFNLDGWHFVSLNSEEDTGPGSPQVAWLRRDLSRYGGTCTAAFWHRPRYDAGSHSDATDVEPFWRALRGRAVAVLNGHDHNYQRFRAVRGITQFIAGAGGREPLHDIDMSDPRLAAAEGSRLGALRLGLKRSAMTYGYRHVDGSRSDLGRIGCRPHRPVIAIDRLGAGRVLPRGSRALAGRARGYAGPLRMSLVRRTVSGACLAFDGGRFRRSSCRARTTFALRDRGAWQLRLPRGPGLEPGTYVLMVRASDPVGRSGSATARFSVR